jgi:hypothetical protein
VTFERVNRHLRNDMDRHYITQTFGKSHIFGALQAIFSDEFPFAA